MNPRPFRQAADSENYQQFTDTLDASTELLSRRLYEANSGLLAMKDEPIALVDACLHTGETLFYAKWALQEAGFNDIRTVVVSDDTLPVRMLEPDMVTSDSIGYCRPFGYDFEVRAPKDDIFITPHQPAAAKAVSNAMRAEVRRIIREEHAARRLEQE